MDVKEQYAAPDPLLNPGIKNFLESFAAGRWGIRAGRRVRRTLRIAQDPIQRKKWTRRFILPLRNVVLINRPFSVSFGGIAVALEPRGAAAADIWAGILPESREASLALRTLEPGMICFDVGSNAGLFAISAAKKIGSRGVFAFEASASARELLRRNLLLNRLGDVHIAADVLGDSIDGTDSLTSTVDSFLEENQIPRVDAIKLGIEGADLGVLRGARKLLERPDAPLVVYEGFGFSARGFSCHPVEILWLLESCGYSLLHWNSETKTLAEITPDFRYDSSIIAVKRSHAAYAKLCEFTP